MSSIWGNDSLDVDDTHVPTLAELRAEMRASTGTAASARPVPVPIYNGNSAPPLRVETKRLMTKKPGAAVAPKKQPSEAQLRAARSSHSIRKFVVHCESPFAGIGSASGTAVTRGHDANSVNSLTADELQFAQAAQRRTTPTRQNADACGNSPFCTNETHRHADDDTFSGRREQRIRASLWARSRKLLADNIVTLPAYPFVVVVVDGAVSVATNSKQMTDEEFLRLLKASDLATHVLALLRVYYAESDNVTRSALAKQAELRAERERQQAEARAAAGEGVHLPDVESINRHAEMQAERIVDEGTDRLRVLELTASEQLRALLRRFNVPRQSVAHAVLFEFMTMNEARLRSEPEVQIRAMIENSLRSLNETGELASMSWPQWNLGSDSSSSSSSAATAEEQRRERTPKRARSPPASSAQVRRSTVVVSASVAAVAPDQFFFEKHCNACTSICVNVVVTLARAAVEASEVGVSEREYIERTINWHRLVENGVNWWLDRLNKSENNEHVMDVLGSGARGDAIRQAFRIFEYAGSLFATKRRPCDEDERLTMLANPDLETALEMCERDAGSLPFACMLTFHNHSIALSAHAHGWHVFDSGGAKIAGHSVLFTMPTRREAIDVVRELFHVDAIDPTEPGTRTADEHVTFSLFGLAPKH